MKKEATPGISWAKSDKSGLILSIGLDPNARGPARWKVTLSSRDGIWWAKTTDRNAQFIGRYIAHPLYLQITPSSRVSGCDLIEGIEGLKTTTDALMTNRMWRSQHAT